MIDFLESRIAPATFIVTSLADADAGSLRDAIAHANDAPGPDIIVFEKGLNGTIDITSGQIEIADTLTIRGPGATKLALDANLRSRFFFVFDGDGAKDSPLTVSGLSFFRGKQPTTAGAGEPGGAIDSLESLNVNGCVFVGNAADGSGGAVTVVQLANGAPVTADIRSSSFLSNFSDRFGGGAISAEVGGAVTLKNNLFSDNVSQSRGGATELSGEVVLVQNCQFLGNRAPDSGALEMDGGDDSTIIVRNSLFAGNTSSEGGSGAAAIFGGKVFIDRSTFLQNKAQSGPGGLNVSGFSSLVIRSSQFLDNASHGSVGGGGVRISVPEGGAARIIGSIIAGNTAEQGGGVLVSSDPGTLQIIGSKIANNHAAGSGGGILVLDDPTSHHSADLSIVRSKITGNVAEDGNGGGMEILGDGEFTMQSSQVTHNSALNGGGVALFKTTPAVIVGSVIAQNVALGGGGIRAVCPLELRTTKILGNVAQDIGGGIRITGQLTLELCTVSGNFALFGGGIFANQEVSQKNSKVIGNFSSDGEQVVVD
jgi:hypothetical protein